MLAYEDRDLQNDILYFSSTGDVPSLHVHFEPLSSSVSICLATALALLVLAFNGNRASQNWGRDSSAKAENHLGQFVNGK